VNYTHKTVCNCIEIPVKSCFYFILSAKGEIRKKGRYPAGYHSTLRTRDIVIRETDQVSNSSGLHAAVVLSRLVESRDIPTAVLQSYQQGHLQEAAVQTATKGSPGSGQLDLSAGMYF